MYTGGTIHMYGYCSREIVGANFLLKVVSDRSNDDKI